MRSRPVFGSKPKHFNRGQIFFFFLASRHSPCSLFSLSWWGSALLTKAKRLEKKEEKDEKKKALCYLHCQNKQVRAQTQRGFIHRALTSSYSFKAKGKINSVWMWPLCPSTTSPIHPFIPSFLSHFECFCSISPLFCVSSASITMAISNDQWPMTFLHALTIKIQLSSSVILWEHSELSSSDHGGVMSVPRHMRRSANRLIGEKLLLTA